MTPRRLDDPKELRRVKDLYEEPVYFDDLTDEERWKRKEIKDNNKTNQAR